MALNVERCTPEQERELAEMGFRRSLEYERGAINTMNTVSGKVIVTVDKGAPFVAPEANFRDSPSYRKLSHFILKYEITSAMAA